MHGFRWLRAVYRQAIHGIGAIDPWMPDAGSLLAATPQHDKASQSSSDNRNSPCEAMHVPRRCVELHFAQHGVGITWVCAGSGTRWSASPIFTLLSRGTTTRMSLPVLVRA